MVFLCSSPSCRQGQMEFLGFGSFTRQALYSLRLCAAVLRVDSLTLALTYSGRWLGWNWFALGGSLLSFYTGGRHTLRLLAGARPSMVSLSAVAAKSGRPRGRPRARWVEYRTYSCALFVRDGPTLSWRGGVAATLPPSFLLGRKAEPKPLRAWRAAWHAA